jgi:hypothetical protein
MCSSAGLGDCERGELADIGAGDEAGGLGRADHQPAQRAAASDIDEALELEQHRRPRVLAELSGRSRVSQAMASASRSRRQALSLVIPVTPLSEMVCARPNGRRCHGRIWKSHTSGR